MTTTAALYPGLARRGARRRILVLAFIGWAGEPCGAPHHLLPVRAQPAMPQAIGQQPGHVVRGTGGA
jgi:hypothetical protein